jgi:para-aminobenzoate synthetase component 1
MLSYEASGALENLPRSKINDQLLPDFWWGFYDLVISFDHHAKKAWICATGFPASDENSRQERAHQRLAWAEYLITNISQDNKAEAQSIAPDQIQANFTPAQYQQAVERVMEYIRAGDIFEANIAQRFNAALEQDFSIIDLYRRLRINNPAPFAALLQTPDWSLVSASPERFVQCLDGIAQTRPIKGTCARHSDPIIDQQRADQLFASVKDRAENIMIVDLMRNDFSRVCLPHSVKVTQLCAVESFATVHHLVSVVEGQLAPDQTAIDLLNATFPGGSITGAPKIRAMEIIAQIEPHVRGPYCGSIGYISGNGNMDFSITIRTFVIANNQITFHVGGAVTLDSDPAAEYQETLTKAKALLRTLTAV